MCNFRRRWYLTAILRSKILLCKVTTLEDFNENLPGLIAFGVFCFFIWLSWKMKASKNRSIEAAGQKLENGLAWFYIVLFCAAMGVGILALMFGVFKAIF